MRQARSFPAVASALILLTACATSGPAPGEGSKEGIDLKALVGRELPAPLPKTRVSLFKGQMTGEIEAAGAIKTDDGKLGDDGEAAEVKVPLGTGGEMSCLVYPEAIPSAATIAKILGEVSKEVHFERVRLVDVKVVEASPAVYLEAEYSANDGQGGKVFGQFKMMLHAAADNPVLCMHDEVGYRASFRRIAEGLFQSLRLAGADAGPRYTDIQVVRVGQVPIGYEITSLLDGKEDKQIVSNDAALFAPRAPDQLAYADTSSTEVADGKGDLVLAVYSKMEEGKPASSVRIDRTAAGQYTFKGEQGGKSINGSFKSRGKRLLSSSAVTEELRRSLLSGKSQELTVEEYHPHGDPTKTIDVVYRRKEGRTVAFQVGGSEVSTVRDERGWVEKASGAGISMERIFVKGTP
ncbi:MAG TPA: hypothetical protein VN914_17535 [Polyangia bacterium]|nr:hypothetical protein [Polyangia bacterium]